MEIITVSLSRPQAGTIARAIVVLKAGGVVAYPTDTAYGLAVDATNEEAIGKIFVMKKRAQKPLPVIVDSEKMVRRYATVDDQAAKYLAKYWPGLCDVCASMSPNTTNSAHPRPTDLGHAHG